MNNKKLRWSGRNSAKDLLRARIWTQLEENDFGIGDVWDSIPNFKGAQEAADRLAEMSFWKKATIIKSNPDDAQIPVRLRALKDGKCLYMPVPELSKNFPFVLLDPEKLKAANVPFEFAATIKGALTHGEKVQFTEMQPMDVLVVGSVAVTKAGGRTGKGAGFADLELGIFREVGTIAPGAVLVTTVHDLQVVDDQELTMQPHDSPLDWVVTPTKAIETKTVYTQPTGISWEHIQPDQFESIPLLKVLASQLSSR